MGQLAFIFVATSNGCNYSYRRFIANANHVDLVGCEEKHLARRHFKLPLYSLAISSSSCTFDSESNRDSRVCVTYLLSTCFSEVAKVFGPIFGTTIPFIFSQRRPSWPSNFAVLFVFLTLKNVKISDFEIGGLQFVHWLFGPKSPRDLREMDP